MRFQRTPHLAGYTETAIASTGRRSNADWLAWASPKSSPRRRVPGKNPYVERVIGSIRRECLNHIIIFNEAHLRRVLTTYVAYYHRSRTHLGLAARGESGFDRQ